MTSNHQEFKFKFSIVTAVYNTEPWVREAIDSVIAQNIGFKANVQLILVDDGSTDGSGAILDKFHDLYPDNIIVIHKDNGGVSTARNEGLKYIEGKYVNFMDSDDKLSRNALLMVWRFLEANYDKTDMVSIPLINFDGRKGTHNLHYKYAKGTRIIDLTKDWDCVQFAVNSVFIKNHVAKTVIHFDSNLKKAEDAKEIVKILLKKLSLGVIHNAYYYYRWRGAGEASAIQTSWQKKWNYLPYIDFFVYDSIDTAKRVTGNIISLGFYSTC